MEHTHTKLKMSKWAGAFAFGAAASLFNNMLVSVGVFVLNMTFAYILPKWYPTGNPSVWVTEVFPLILLIACGVLGVWAAACVVAWLFKRRHVVVQHKAAPALASVVFAIPILFWVVAQSIGAYLYSQTPDLTALGYLFAQILIFGGALYFFVERYRRKHMNQESHVAPMIETSHKLVCYVAAVLTVLASGALVALFHALEVALFDDRPIVVVGPAVLGSDLTVLLGLFGIAALLFVATFFLRKNKTVAGLKKTLVAFAAYEYFFACISAASGLLTMLGVFLQADFLFTPYTTLIVTTIVLLGVVFAAIRHAEGKRDPMFIWSRVAAYLIGFFGQPTVMGVILTLIQGIGN